MAKAPITFTQEEKDTAISALQLQIESSQRQMNTAKTPAPIKDLYKRVGEQTKALLDKIQQNA